MNTKELEKSVNNICSELIDSKGYISSIDVLLGLGYLSKKDYEDWRFKKVPFLEKVCKVNLSKLGNIIAFIKRFSKNSNLKASWTSYKSYGKSKKITLQFSKSGKASIEKSYSTHYVLVRNE